MHSGNIFVNIPAKLKKTWMRLIYRGADIKSIAPRMDLLYFVKDPWGMDSVLEQTRFLETNRLLLEKFGKVGTLLEIGCGEGHQSIHLMNVCDRLTGVDISGRAVERARVRCPGGRFFVGDLARSEIADLAPFDLVTACEVLYYMTDPAEALERIRALGRNGFITYYDRMLKRLDPLVLSMPGIATEILEWGGSSWRVTWWFEK